MPEEDLSTIKAPKSVKKDSAPAGDVVIHVMPKEFFGKEASAKAPIAQVAPPPPPKKVKPVAAPKPPVPKKKSRTPLFILAGIIFLIALAVGGYLVVQSVQPEPEPAPEPQPQPEPQPAPEPEPEPTITRGIDTDTDGLTDREESLYGTDFRNPDSDGDSYLDGNEVFHRFDPIGFAPSTLLDTGSVVEYIEDDYRLTYPRSWTLSSSPDAISLQSTTSARFNVTRHDFGDADSFEAWYRENISTSVPQFIAGESKEGYVTYEREDDEMVIYMLANGSVFEFRYLLGNSLTIDYLQTFQMVVNSFIYTPQP